MDGWNIRNHIILAAIIFLVGLLLHFLLSEEEEDYFYDPNYPGSYGGTYGGCYGGNYRVNAYFSPDLERSDLRGHVKSCTTRMFYAIKDGNKYIIDVSRQSLVTREEFDRNGTRIGYNESLQDVSDIDVKEVEETTPTNRDPDTDNQGNWKEKPSNDGPIPTVTIRIIEYYPEKPSPGYDDSDDNDSDDNDSDDNDSDDNDSGDDGSGDDGSGDDGSGDDDSGDDDSGDVYGNHQGNGRGKIGPPVYDVWIEPKYYNRIGEELGLAIHLRLNPKFFQKGVYNIIVPFYNAEGKRLYIYTPTKKYFDAYATIFGVLPDVYTDDDYKDFILFVSYSDFSRARPQGTKGVYFYVVVSKTFELSPNEYKSDMFYFNMDDYIVES